MYPPNPKWKMGREAPPTNVNSAHLDYFQKMIDKEEFNLQFSS